MAGGHRWVVIADSPFLPARGGGEREHLGFVRAVAEAGWIAALVVPATGPLALAPYRELIGELPVLVSRRRESRLLLAHPVEPYVVASRPTSPRLLDQLRDVAPDADGVVVFSYKSWRIAESVARGLELPAVLRQHNLEGAYHRSLARETSGPRGLVLGLEAHRIEQDERRLEKASWLRAVADISASDAEVRRRRGASAMHLPPFAHDPALLALPRRTGSQRVLFVGTLDVSTNTAALEWFLTGAWDRIRAAVPEARLDVVGRAPSPALRRRLQSVPGLELHADVPQVEPYLSQAAVAINPTVTGSGVNIKLVDYLQAGVPVVTTRQGAAGLGRQIDEVVLLADDPPNFAQAVIRLLADPQDAEALGRRGRERITQLLDPTTNLARLEEALHGPDVTTPTPSGRRRHQITAQLEELSDLAGPGRADWDALHERQTGVANPFTAPEWTETWYRHFTRPEDRRLLTVRRDGELLGIAPLFVDRGARGAVTRLRLVGSGQGGSLLECPQVLSAPEHTREVIRAVVAATLDGTVEPSVDWTELSLPTAHGWFEPEWVYSSGRPTAFYRPQLTRAAVVLPLDADWDRVRSSFKRNLKESLRRSRNRIRNDGRAVKVLARSTDLDVAAADAFLSLHGHRAAHASGVHHGDVYAAPEPRAFIRDLLPRLGSAGRATLHELYLDERLVAVQLALAAPGVVYLHSSGLCPEAWPLGAVTFLQEGAIREAAEQGAHWANFSPGPNVAKLRWSERVDVHQDFAYGAGSRSLEWKYAAFAARQAVGELRHAVMMAAANAAPRRADAGGGSLHA